jgi:hypothetical protein
LKRTLDEIRYNLQQAEQMGLIEVGSKPLNGEWKILRLTPSGHDFLRQAEVLTLKPTLWGMSIDLKAGFKALWRRLRHGWRL